MNVDVRNQSSGWHSFDRTPWKHPWLTSANLEFMRSFSQDFIGRVIAHCDRRQAWDLKLKTAFVGNIANNLYMRGAPLRGSRFPVDVFLHPQDQFVMSHPSWEEFGGELDSPPGTIEEARAAGICLPEVEGVFQLQPLPDFSWTWTVGDLRFYLKNYKNRWSWFYLDTIRALRSYDALLAVQCPYLALLSGRRFLVAQMGGEIWYEASRMDWLGGAQREAYRRAQCFLVSNPWSYAHARRFGLKNLVQVPFMLDDDKYSPGSPASREEWKEKVGGDFFVVCTSRLDDAFKGSSMALRGFRRFAEQRKGARLVVMNWGSDTAKIRQNLMGDPILDKILFLPVAGKRKLIDHLRSADCLLDQFTIGYYGASALEAMLVCTPVVMRLESKQYEALCEGGAPPVLSCENELEIANSLMRLHDDEGFRKQAGLNSRQWAQANHGSSRWAKRYQALLLASCTGFKWDYRASILNRPLGPKEIQYHKYELANAPEYPNYT